MWESDFWWLKWPEKGSIRFRMAKCPPSIQLICLTKMSLTSMVVQETWLRYKNHANSYYKLYLQSLIRQVPKSFTLVRHAVQLHGVCLHSGERGGRKVLGCSAGHGDIYICSASRIWTSGVWQWKAQLFLFTIPELSTSWQAWSGGFCGMTRANPWWCGRCGSRSLVLN